MRDLKLASLILVLLSSNVLAQQSTTSAVKNVQVTASAKEAEVGQEVKLTVVATDASGKVLSEKPSTYFAGPFDIAAVDDDGNVKLFGTGEVIVGALVGGTPGFTTFMVKAPGIKTIELGALKSPLVVGGSVPIDALTRMPGGNPRTGIPLKWTSSNTQVAIVDAGGVVTGIGPGKAVITATSGNATANTSISVVKNNLRSVTVTGAKSAQTGDVVYFTANCDPDNDVATRWSVSGNTATIDADGGFVAERPGTYIVTATTGNISNSTSIVVTPRRVQREMNVVGRVPFKEFQGAEQWIIGNYAYYSTISDRFLVYDISNPTEPKLTDTITVDARLVNDITTTADGKILVISREGASNRKNGIAFYDTSDPAHPKLISEYTATVTGGVHSAFVDGHYVYLTDDATGSLRVIDFRDVKNPKEVARWQTENPLVVSISTKEGETTTGGRYLHDVYVKDGLAYLAYWHDGLVILDVGAGMKGGSPEKPQLVSQFRFNHHELYGDGWLAGTHSVYRYRNYVFVGDEVFPSLFDIKSQKRFPVRGIVHVIDVSDIKQPRKVAEYPVPEGGAHNMWVENDVMYLGYYSGGARVVDVSGELRGDLYSQGREIGSLWTGDAQGFRANLPFTWGAQPHNGLIYFNDIHSGLWIVKLGDKIDKGSTTAPGQ